MNSLLLDLRTALRFFARRRAAFAVIVLTMALALGANTAVFSVLKAFVFSNLGVPGPDRVMFVWTTRELPGRGRVDFSDAHANYKLLRATTGFWQSLAATFAADAKPLWPYLAVALVVLGLTQLASFLPARRAAKLDVHLVLTGA